MLMVKENAIQCGKAKYRSGFFIHFLACKILICWYKRNKKKHIVSRYEFLTFLNKKAQIS